MGTSLYVRFFYYLLAWSVWSLIPYVHSADEVTQSPESQVVTEGWEFKQLSRPSPHHKEKNGSTSIESSERDTQKSPVKSANQAVQPDRLRSMASSTVRGA
ncbi:hypothetical protein AGIG_G24737 [Arapaima gigas]